MKTACLLPTLVAAGLGACTPTLDRQQFRLEELEARTQEIASLESTRSLRSLAEPANVSAAAAQEDSDRLIAMLRSGTPRPLALVEVRERTLANNLGIQATLISPQVAAQVLRAEQAKFESTFTASVIDRRTVSPAYYGGPPINTESDALLIVPGLEVPLQTGGKVSLDWTLATQKFTTSDDTLGDQSFAYSQPSISLQQPLLRGAGIEYNQASIVLAQAQLGLDKAAAQLAVIDQLVAAEVAYWSVHLARRELNIAIETYETSRSLLDNQRVLVERGAGSIANVYNFEVALSVAFDQVLEAERRLRLAVRRLKVVMQEPDLSLDGSISLEPTTPPQLVAYKVDPQILVEFAMRNRADLLQFEYQRIQRTVDVMMRDNETLPELNLVAAWTLNGFDFTGRSLNEATSNLDGGNPAGWAIGANARVPIGNEARLAAYQAALLRRLQAVATLRNRQVTVAGEVLDALDSLDVQWNRILTSRYQEEASNRFFDAYKTLFDRGQIASANLTQALQAVNSAGVNRARAEADYQIALARLAQAAGCLLGHAGVEWSDRLDEPRLAAPDVDPAAALPDSFMGPRSELRDSPAPAAPPGNAGGTDAPSPTDPSAVGPPVEPVQP